MKISNMREFNDFPPMFLSTDVKERRLQIIENLLNILSETIIYPKLVQDVSDKLNVLKNKVNSDEKVNALETLEIMVLGSAIFSDFSES